MTVKNTRCRRKQVGVIMMSGYEGKSIKNETAFRLMITVLDTLYFDSTIGTAHWSTESNASINQLIKGIKGTKIIESNRNCMFGNCAYVKYVMQCNNL